MTIKVAVIGAAGRMGRTVIEAVDAAPDLDLAATVDLGDDLGLITEAGAQVAVDFSVPDAAPANVAWLIDHGVHAVVGATGWDEARLTTVRDHLGADPTVGVLIAPNFALGAVLAMRFAQLAAPYYESAEVVELHHPDKVDAPSGTARHTGELITQTRRQAGLSAPPDATNTGLDGARGAQVGDVRVHAVRLRGLVAHEEILFGGPGEQLTIRHDSFDRVSFMPGVLLGVRNVGSRPGLTVGLDGYLDL
ncbi:MAG: 4-hydroxy-tetrahydrodipicolinate reductase [Actinomycetales bacterium]